MSKISDATDLDSCQCCEVAADPSLENRPGLSALSYRVGTYATFFEHMKAQIARQSFDTKLPGTRPLAGLTTRDGDDPAIALLDATAVVSEILSFYQERIINEGYLRTALERRSVLELAREIGYELNPGVAASTYLAFIVDQPLVTPSPILMPTKVELSAGTKVQSVPSQGQLPQTFETVAAITARVEWNQMAARSVEPQNLTVSGHRLLRADARGNNQIVVDRIFLQGTATNLKPGDLLLFRQGVISALIFVSDVTPDFDGKRTQVGLSQLNAQPPPAFSWLSEEGQLADTQLRPLNAHTAFQMIVAPGQNWNERDLSAYINIQQWDPDELLKLVRTRVTASEAPQVSVFAFRARSGVFGNQAPPYTQLKLTTVPPCNWDEPPQNVAMNSCAQLYSQLGFGADLFLERVVSGIAIGSLTALVDHATMVPFRIKSTTEASIADFAMSGKATGLKLEKLGSEPDLDTSDNSPFTMRSTSVWYQSEQLLLDRAPIDAPIWSASSGPGVTAITLDGMVLGLKAGQLLALTGTTTDDDGASTGVTHSEIVRVVSVSHKLGYSTINFTPGLQSTYVRRSVSISGNVAPATHGETIAAETLGSGDGSAVNQRFTLSRPPLTYVSAPSASGGQSTLTVRVNGVAWQGRESLYGLPADSPSYIVRNGDDGKTTVIFGDGKNGARLPTGQTNVVASYRAGLGLAGELAASALTILANRPLGLKSVTNPLPAMGSAPAEAIDNAQQNAPRTVRTLERIVSLADFTDFARTFSGIAKAQAVALWSGQKQIVHVTVASATGGSVDPSSSLYSNLKKAMLGAGDNAHAIVIDSFLPRSFKLDANVMVDPNHDSNVVLPAVDAAIRAAFSFASREFAQGVSEAEVMDVIQGIPGVVATDINWFHDANEAQTLRSFILADPAHFDGTVMRSATLLLLHPAGLVLTAVAP
jgi:hypothetical protein